MRRKELVSDIDEVLFNAAEKHHSELTAIGQRRGWNNLPDYAAFRKAGGSHTAYGHQEGYWEINREMVASEEFNRDLPVVKGAVEGLDLLASNLLLYLTTRPESLTRVTEEELAAAGFPEREVICRPAAIDIRNTTVWKLDVLTQLAKEKHLIMLDDSFSLNQAILAENHPRIATILFKGDITPSHIDAKDWSEIIEMGVWL